MNFTPEALYAINKGYSQLFQRGLLSDRVPVLWEEKAERVDSPGVEINLYGWLAEMPQFKKWIGPRTASRLAARSYQLKNEKYQFAYSIGRDDIKYDRVGVYNGHFSRAGLAARVFWDRLLTEAQKNGKTVKCFDGQFYYDTDHPVDPEDSASATFLNLRTSFDLTQANFDTSFAYMATLKDANGESMDTAPNILECNSKLRRKALEVLQASLILREGVASGSAAAISNVLAGDCQLKINNRLEDGVWYLHHTAFMKPFIVQVESMPTGLESRFNPEDPHVWENDEFLFGARACGAAGYTLPHLSTRHEV